MTSRLLPIFALLVSAFAAQGENAPEIVKWAGKPFIVRYDKDRIAGLKQIRTISLLSSTVVLSENSCSAKVGVKFTYNLPIVRRSLIAYWIRHPKFAGQLVKKSGKDASGNSAIVAITTPTHAGSSPNFASVAAKSDLADPQAKAARDFAVARPGDMGWLECSGVPSCRGILPKATEALVWDENFEMANEDLPMIRSEGTPSVNQMSSRLLNVPLRVEGNRIVFSSPQRNFGLTTFYPPGVTYQLNWLINSKNLVEAEDSRCEMKWDMDFTSSFSQAVKSFEQVNESTVGKLSDLPLYYFDPDDLGNFYLRAFFEASGWQNDEIVK